MIADSYEMKEVEDNFFFEVEGNVSSSKVCCFYTDCDRSTPCHLTSTTALLQWVTVGDVDVDIGANPSAEEAEEGTDSSARKVVDIVDSFRLVVCFARRPTHRHSVVCCKTIQRAKCFCRSNQDMTKRASWDILR